MHGICQLVNTYHPLILHVQETWLSATIADALVTIPGYDLLRNDRLTGFGGVATYVAEGTDYALLTPHYTDGYESIWVSIKLANMDLTMVNIYRPPKSNVNLFINSLERELANRRNFIIAGDFNIDGAKQNSPLANFLARNNLRQLVNCPTYIRAATTIDLLVTDTDMDITVETASPIGSDHIPVVGRVVLSAPRSRPSKRSYIQVRSKYIKTEAFLQSINAVCESYLNRVAEGADTEWTRFTAQFADTVNEYFPVCEMRTRHKNRIPLTPNLRRCISNRKTMYKKARLTQSDMLWKHYHSYNRVLNKALRAYNTQILRERVESAKDVKSKWRALRTIIRGKKNASANDVPIAADVFAIEFKNLVEQAVGPTSGQDGDGFLDYLDPFDSEQLVFPEVTSHDVQMAIQRLSPKSANFDNIPASIVIDCSEPVSRALAKLINASFFEGVYPSCLKGSKIIPVFKKGNRSSAANYRPISLIPVFAKVFETVVYNVVHNYLSRNSLYSSTQYGFRPGYSTTQACADAIDHVSKLVDNGYTTGIVFLDVTKAFDSVNHKILLRKMVFYGFGTNVVKWFASYLADRTAFVQVGAHTADYSGPEIGVPQGSILGPLLYNVYVNDLSNAAFKCRITQYADDTCLLVKSRKDANSLQKKMESATSSVISWFKANRLSVNVQKSKLIAFGKLRREIKSIHVGTQLIASSDDIVYLGLRIDSRLKWHGHIQYVVSRIKQFRLLLSRLKGVFNLSLRIYLTKVLILPVIDLYDFIYCSGTSSDLHRLNVAYNDLMRSVLGIRRSEHMPISDLYKLTTLNALVDRRNCSLLRFMTKVVNDRIFCMFRSDCVRCSTPYATRSQNVFVVPKFSTNVGFNRICVRGLKLLNKSNRK